MTSIRSGSTRRSAGLRQLYALFRRCFASASLRLAAQPLDRIELRRQSRQLVIPDMIVAGIGPPALIGLRMLVGAVLLGR